MLKHIASVGLIVLLAFAISVGIAEARGGRGGHGGHGGGHHFGGGHVGGGHFGGLRHRGFGWGTWPYYSVAAYPYTCGYRWIKVRRHHRIVLRRVYVRC
jgi:hypothetical protein